MKRKISYISILGLDQNTFGKEIKKPKGKRMLNLSVGGTQVILSTCALHADGRANNVKVAFNIYLSATLKGGVISEITLPFVFIIITSKKEKIRRK